jgi:hypothetical protein
MTAMKRYALEIYLPGNSGRDVTCLIESDEPFLPIQKGDVINPRSWTHHYFETLQSYHPSEFGVLLKVTGVEHFIFQREDGFSQHKLGIFSVAVDDLEESRKFES